MPWRLRSFSYSSSAAPARVSRIHALPIDGVGPLVVVQNQNRVITQGQTFAWSPGQAQSTLGREILVIEFKQNCPFLILRNALCLGVKLSTRIFGSDQGFPVVRYA